ncbi:transposase, partial [Massilimicrobiota sp. An142]
KWYPSSQTCHVCGTVHDITKDLSVREWTCPDCHTHHNRDVNAAINILNAGMQMMA